ncbi:MAG TPA: hypothetical protein VG756_05620 [Pseudonocardiaceae bacterium]|jgi:Mce-associated membrane protein|nr:hypothetical protein [Pseudonocardiaceae bacterium]
MSPQTPRRRSGSTPPPRRPKVAGLRRPSNQAETDADQQHDPADARDTEVIPAVKAEDGAPGSTEDTEDKPARKPTPRPRKRSTETHPAADAAPRGRRGGTLVADEESSVAVKERPESEPDTESGEDDKPGMRDRITRLVSGGAKESRNPMLVPLVLGVVTVILGGCAVWFALEWNSLRGGVQAENTALTDNAGTSEVVGQVTSAVNTLFSYNYTDLGKTQNAVPTLLTGNAVCEYNLIFKTVQQQAPGQKLVLTTTVVDSGVQMLEGDTARVLLIVDQHDTRASTNQTSDATAAFAVNATKSDNSWKISAIDTFNGQATQSCTSK